MGADKQDNELYYQPFLLNELTVPDVRRESADGDADMDAPKEPSPAELLDQAQAILDQARKQAEETEREAYEQGFKQGEKDGQEIGSMKLVKILERIEQICQDLDSYHEKFVHLHEKEILSLIASIAGKVLKVQVDMDQETVKRSVMDALASASDWQEVTIRVDPTDFEFMDDMRPEFFEKVNSLRSINIVPDSSVEKGGCIVSADFGEVDARIQSRLDKVAQAMMDVYYSRRV